MPHEPTGESQVVFDKLTQGEARAEIWPAVGCNCVRWKVAGQELLYAPTVDELAERPTRGGIPILFPFPNRIRDGRFAWGGREYQLPRNDSTKRNAIHGFTPRNAWRVADGCLTAEFQISIDAPDSRDLWPADARIRVAIRLSNTALRYEATVENPDSVPLPFGLGYHPYFATTPNCRIQTPARAHWELVDGLPTGRRLPLDGEYDLREPRTVAVLTLDDVYTDLPATAADADGLVERGRIEYPEWSGLLSVRTSPAFRELVLFTPPHRKAVCLEPYTCPTDAIHLQEREDVGWRVLAPGEKWHGVVEYRWENG
jgi:aldose 1-epimerase